jgi:NADH-quinone oxidoreductase subunit C
MTAQTGPTTAPTSTPTVADPYAPSGAHAAVHAAAVEGIGAAFGEALIETIAFRGETTLVVGRERIREILAFLRQGPATGFDRLSDLTAVDYLDLGGALPDHPANARFAVVYHLMSRSNLARLRVRALVPEDEPWIDTVVDLFPSANWLEREVFDLFGIAFRGHPDPKRIMMPEDWDGHPLRKDYPIGAEEIDFSFNHTDIDAARPQTSRDREERYRSARPVNNF